ncbi:MAG: hypothetical protein JW822_05605 [Spirochaetales bacterium]|nr:hypothetical protein [Spirochaetales bacterium]
MGFWDRMKEVLDKSIETSKDVLIKAKEKAQELGEKGVLKYEIMQLEKNAEKKLALLGAKTFELLVKEDKNSISKSTQGVKEILEDIMNIEEKIDGKEEALKNL